MRERVQAVPSVSGIEIDISAKREWWPLAFLPFWLAFWTFGGIMAIRMIAYPEASTPRLFISLWLVGWAFGEVWALYQWLWIAFGKEIAKVAEGELILKRDILGYGRSRHFPVGAVMNLRATGYFPSTSGWSNYFAKMKLAGGTVGFDCLGATQRFGVQLTESEAQQVVRELQPHLR